MSTPGLLARRKLERPVLDVAPRLLNCVVEHRTDEGTVAVRLTEVEAYRGEDDPGSHAFRGRTPRNAVMFGPAGHVYVYFTYGMHWCMNVVCEPAGQARAVLLRAGEVVEGVDLARARRPAARSDRDLARGPARLTQALGVSGAQNGADASTRDSPLRLFEANGAPSPRAVATGPRVGIRGDGASAPWRFWLPGEPTVSVYRPAAARRAGRSGT